MQGKRILVTGGSAGLGAAIVRSISKAATALPADCIIIQVHHLAARGAICAVNFASDEKRGQALLDSLQGKGHVLVKGSMFEKQEAQSVVSVSARIL
jgi:FlaA1/EpsC-like NDP-sugar epimerase